MRPLFLKKSPAIPAPVIDDEKTIDGEEADTTGLDLFDEGDDDPEDAEKRQKHYVAVFLFLKTTTLDRIDTLTAHLATGISTQDWAATFREELTAAHSEAWMVGRRLAGDVQALGQRDVTGGTEAWARQEEFFAKFLQDVESGRYTNADGSLNEAALTARANQYGEAIRGTAHDSFKTAMGTEVLAWVLGTKEHCQPQDDFLYYCVGLSEEDPKPANEWPTSPGMCATPCRVYCDCGFESTDGKFTTKGI